MADEDVGARRPPQAYDTVSPAGVGTTTTNQVSPGTMQEIIDTGDRSLIDQAFDQMTLEDMTAYLESLPSPPSFGAASPAGVRSQASHTPSTEGARTPHRGSPRLSSSGARTPPSQGSARLLAAAGAGGGGGGGGGMMAVAAVVVAVLPVDDQDEAEVEAEDENDDDPASSTLPLLAMDTAQSFPTSHPTSHLEPSGFTTTLTHVVTRSRTIGARTGNCQCHHDQ